MALGIEPETQPKKPIFKEYTVTISATEEQVSMLKSAMTNLGIVYKGVIELSF
jgi:formylmethanofuran dehydrogenase subunit D